MHRARSTGLLLIVLVLGTTQVWADAYLRIYTSTQSATVTPSAMPMPPGYFPVGDTTLIHQEDTMTAVGTHNGHEESNYWHERVYNSTTAVNSSATLSTGAVPVAVSLEPGHSIASASGYANASTMRMGMYGSAASLNPGGARGESYSNAEITNRFTVLPGTSGLAAGTPVTLRWNFSIVGHMSLGATTFPDDSNAYGDVNVNVNIIRGILECSEGCWHPSAAGFGLDVTAEAYDVYAPYWGYGGAAYTDMRWGADSNLGLNESGSDNPGVHDTNVNGSSFPWSVYVNVDSSNFAPSGMYFQAYVGETLTFNADMWQYLAATGNGSITSDFFHTMDFGFGTVTSGIQLDWEVPLQNQGQNPIPEPASLLLMGTGMAAAGALRKWKARIGK